MTEKSRVPWLSTTLFGLLAFVLSVIANGAIVAGYAFTIAIQARAAPDPHKISAFANQAMPILGPLMLSLLVVFAARRVVRRASAPQLWHGALVGVVAALPTLMFTGVPGPFEAVGLLLPPASGLLGAYWGLSAGSRSRSRET